MRWSAEDLAREAALSVTTVRRAELTASETSLTHANDRAIRRALEAAGIDFIDEDGGGPGVRLRKSATITKPSRRPYPTSSAWCATDAGRGHRKSVPSASS
jgi:hypothetical protein